jgi:trehalose utilization protein
MPPIRVTVWNEFRHERHDPRVAAHYPAGLHVVIAEALQAAGLTAHTATLDEPEHGLSEAVLAATDVLIWWGHAAHAEVDDAIVERLQRRVVVDGMGLIVLHSGHFSKLFCRLMGTTCNLKWREGNDRERLWVVAPGHPIVAGIDETIELAGEEMYGEPFDVPPPETLIFISWFTGGEVFRSGACYTRGQGRIFYFRPGHETLPTYHHPQIQRVIVNAARWAAPQPLSPRRFGRSEPREA